MALRQAPCIAPPCWAEKRGSSTCATASPKCAVGAAPCCSFRGETGIGKTRLLLEALSLASRAALRVFCVRCDDGEARTGRDLLGPLRPFLAAMDGTAGEPIGPPDEGGPREVWLEALVGRMLASCRARPLLLTVDDVDRADDMTKTVLQRLVLSATATESTASNDLHRVAGACYLTARLPDPFARAAIA